MDSCVLCGRALGWPHSGKYQGALCVHIPPNFHNPQKKCRTIVEKEEGKTGFEWFFPAVFCSQRQNNHTRIPGETMVWDRKRLNLHLKWCAHTCNELSSRTHLCVQKMEPLLSWEEDWIIRDLHCAFVFLLWREQSLSAALDKRQMWALTEYSWNAKWAKTHTTERWSAWMLMCCQ